MQPAVRGVSATSTATFFQGTDAGAQSSSEFFAHPYGLCTPQRVFASLATRRQAAFRVFRGAVVAPPATPEPAPARALNHRAPVTAPAGAPA